MKKQHLLKSMLLLCVLVVGSGIAWAADKAITLTVNNIAAGSYSNDEKTFQESEITFGYVRFIQNSKNTPSGWAAKQIMQNNKTTGVNSSIYNKDAIPGKIKSIRIVYASAFTNYTLSYGSSSTSMTAVTTLTSQSGTESTTYPNNNDVNTTGNLPYYEYDLSSYDATYFKYEATGANYIYKIVITYEEATVSTGKETSVTINDAGITNTDISTSTVAGKLTASIKDEDDAAVAGVVTWASDNKAVATVGSDGSLTLVGAGTATITASYAGLSGTYKSSSKTYDLTVTDSNPYIGEGTAAKPFTVAQARAKVDEDNTKTTSGAYVKGIVAKRTTTSLPTAGYITYFISDDGKDANTIQCYRGMSYNGDKFSALSDISVGDKVVICGDLLLYNNATYELNTGNELVTKWTSVKEVGADGWATYITEADVEFEPENAFVVSAAGSSVTLKPVTQVPSGTPLVLKGEGRKYVTTLATTPAAPTNSLLISDGAGAGTTNDYVLGKKNGVAGFYKWNGGNLSADKVYLPAAAVCGSAHEFLGFDIDVNNEVTGISKMEKMRNGENEIFYNLAGQRVAQPTKGLYIVNGKKVVVK